MSQEKIMAFFEGIESWPWQKVGLWILVFFSSTVAITLSLQGKLPLDETHFFYVLFLLLLLCLYRPRWGFLGLVFFIPFEAINLAPAFFGADLRPYQVLTITLFVALIVHVLGKKIPIEKFRSNTLDGLLVLFFFGAVLSLLGTPAFLVSLKQVVVLASFLALYFVMRFFLKQVKREEETIRFFFGGALVVMLFALWQNIRDILGYPSYMVMVGRPNSTFFEADWLGFFVTIVILLLANRILFVKKKEQRGIFLLAYGVMLVLATMVLILTISRSAWLATAAGIVVLVGGGGFMVWTHTKHWKEYAKRTAFLGAFVLGAFVLVFTLGLTRFDISERAESTTNGYQLITIACESEIRLPERIETVAELPAYQCEHITLEAISENQRQGKFIKEIERRDPNFAIRSSIYEKTWNVLKEHPFLGVGLGTSSLFLGIDERGAGLNSSNLFLEAWLGAGLLGLGALLVLWGMLTVRFFKGWLDGSERHLLGGALLVGLTVFNLFNAGMFMGSFFFVLALIVTWSRPLSYHEER